jgi:hypothetical protein
MKVLILRPNMIQDVGLLGRVIEMNIKRSHETLAPGADPFDPTIEMNNKK